MAFFNKLSSLAQSAVDKTNDMLETNKLNASINAEKTKIAELKGKIGEYYWTRYASGEAIDDEPAQLCGEIKTREEKIASLEAEIQAKKEEAQQAVQASSSAPTGQTVSAGQAAASVSADAIACPACGTANPASSKFCQGCGGKLEQPPAAETLSCPACGADNVPGTKFCSQCGVKLEKI
ncbi:MAG: zinc ribbon domain-containing protein [Firmicutes bacterium]|nr:zinc ribbon domain-containing protein [Bacillota bacterium]